MSFFASLVAAALVGRDSSRISRFDEPLMRRASKFAHCSAKTLIRVKPAQRESC